MIRAALFLAVAAFADVAKAQDASTITSGTIVSSGTTVSAPLIVANQPISYGTVVQPTTVISAPTSFVTTGTLSAPLTIVQPTITPVAQPSIVYATPGTGVSSVMASGYSLRTAYDGAVTGGMAGGCVGPPPPTCGCAGEPEPTCGILPLTYTGCKREPVCVPIPVECNPYEDCKKAPPVPYYKCGPDFDQDKLCLPTEECVVEEELKFGYYTVCFKCCSFRVCVPTKRLTVKKEQCVMKPQTIKLQICEVMTGKWKGKFDVYAKNIPGFPKNTVLMHNVTAKDITDAYDKAKDKFPK